MSQDFIAFQHPSVLFDWRRSVSCLRIAQSGAKDGLMTSIRPTGSKSDPVEQGESAVSLRDTSVLILAGGQGTRLRSKVSSVPKPLAPIKGRPFITYLLEKIVRCQPAKIVLCTGYMAEKFDEQVGNAYRGFPIDYSVEIEALGTGGAIRQAIAHVNTESILVCNGDSYIDADLDDFEGWHSQKASALSIILTHVPDTSRFGRAETDDKDRILRFREKQPGQGEGWINAGMYLGDTRVFSEIPRNTRVSLESDFFQQYMSCGNPVYGYPSVARFIDIGTPETFTEAQDFFRS